MKTTHDFHRRPYLRNLCIIAALFISINLTGCASSTLLSPCPNFGASCKKLPVNVGSWNVPMAPAPSAPTGN